ncbi:LOW QUALITY PROTEIN: uncharacterized protein LOC116926553 [Daphnia magna]|uniref:LOW QUALITY PROTEIN: uncharacterized protein LOC116926553 n=1 Tax=Daphnia magna TaxID=35525 RepID=UPI001E1BC6AF|nr:LOW QUALITY PROTEIN: uncharacterized protein LOC116926553 [Daphnia magna]
MVPNSEESNGATSSTEQTALKSSKTSKGKITPSKSVVNLEKDTEEYRKLRDRNNEAVKKSRTRTKLRTQDTLDKVEKLRDENTKLEDRIEGLKKELELLKELFVSHAGTKSMKRLTEVDLDVLIAEAAPNSKKSKKAGTPYTGRSREEIEKEVIALLGQQDEECDNEEEPQPSTSRDIDQTDMSEHSLMEDHVSANNTVDCVDLANEHEAQEILTVESSEEINADGEITETYTIVDDGTGGPHIWTTEDGESVVVTIEQDEQGTLVASTVQQQDINDIIQGEILMLE